jgi:hypothetical protein
MIPKYGFQNLGGKPQDFLDLGQTDTREKIVVRSDDREEVVVAEVLIPVEADDSAG